MKQEDNWKKRFEDKFIVVWTNNGGETEMQRTLCAKGSEDFEDFIRSEKQKSFNSALEEIEKIIGEESIEMEPHFSKFIPGEEAEYKFPEGTTDTDIDRLSVRNKFRAELRQKLLKLKK